ncbi:MAG: hypothetical protein ABJF67_06570 [Aurantimonas coralicida]|jgi:hypothetical protein|nr:MULTISPECIES: hypothetical protein [Aurantimonadaceae]MAU97702.1 hypothetical protein [Fulvimarina sp.]MCQ0989852.1 hypothetical protein [Jiella sp. LLJ827]
MTETPPAEDDLTLLQRHWPHGHGADPDAVSAVAEAIYDGRRDWEIEFAGDRAAIRQDGKGGLESQGRIDRMLMKRWRNGERRIPEWMAAGLLRPPGIVRTRRQQDIERWLAELSAQDREARDFIAAEEARLHGRVAAQVARYVPSVVRDPVKRPNTRSRRWRCAPTLPRATRTAICFQRRGSRTHSFSRS